jgi:hypothetical protein
MVAAKWESMYYHVTNRHLDLPNALFPACCHAELEAPRIWLEDGWYSHKHLLQIFIHSMTTTMTLDYHSDSQEYKASLNMFHLAFS